MDLVNTIVLIFGILVGGFVGSFLGFSMATKQHIEIIQQVFSDLQKVTHGEDK